MTSAFPASLDNLLTSYTNTVKQKNIHPAAHNDADAAINAVQDYLLNGRGGGSSVINADGSITFTLPAGKTFEINRSVAIAGPSPWIDLDHSLYVGSQTAPAAVTAGIQAAITALAALGGGRIHGTKAYECAASGNTYNSGDGITGLPYALETDNSNPSAPLEFDFPKGAGLKLAANQPANTCLFIVSGTSAARHTGAVYLRNMTFDGNAKNQVNTWTDHGMVTAFYGAEVVLDGCYFTAPTFNCVQIMRDTYDAWIHGCTIDLDPATCISTSSGLRLEAAGIIVDHCILMTDAVNGFSLMQIGDNADANLLGKEIRICFNQFFGSYAGQTIGVGGTVSCLIYGNYLRDGCNLNCVAIQVDNYINGQGGVTGGKVFDTLHCAVIGNDIVNYRAAIKLGGSDSSMTVNGTAYWYSIGARHTLVSGNHYYPRNTIENNKTSFVGGVTYPVYTTRAYGTPTDMNQLYFITETTNGAVGQNDICDNECYMTTATATAYICGSPLSRWARNRARLTGGASAFSAPNGGEFDENRVLITGTGTGNAFNMTGAKLTNNSVLSLSAGSVTAFNVTNCAGRGNTGWVVTGTVWNNNSSTTGPGGTTGPCVEDNDFLNTPPLMSNLGACPAFTATPSTASGTLPADTYHYTAYGIDGNGLIVAASATVNATLGAPGHITVGWTPASGNVQSLIQSVLLFRTQDSNSDQFLSIRTAAQFNFSDSSSANVTTRNIVSNPGSTMGNNNGYKTRNGGKASVANGGTIAHGLGAFNAGVAPGKVTFTPTAASRAFYVNGAPSTSVVTVGLTDLTGTPIAVAEDVYWMAEV